MIATKGMRFLAERESSAETPLNWRSASHITFPFHTFLSPFTRRRIVYMVGEEKGGDNGASLFELRNLHQK